MIGCIKAISPCVKSASAKLFLDLHTVLAPSGEQRYFLVFYRILDYCARAISSRAVTLYHVSALRYI